MARRGRSVGGLQGFRVGFQAFHGFERGVQELQRASGSVKDLVDSAVADQLARALRVDHRQCDMLGTGETPKSSAAGAYLCKEVMKKEL